MSVAAVFLKLHIPHTKEKKVVGVPAIFLSLWLTVYPFYCLSCLLSSSSQGIFKKKEKKNKTHFNVSNDRSK